MSTLNLHDAALAVLEDIERMSDAELIAALEECSHGPLSYAFEAWCQRGFGGAQLGAVAHYVLNDREILRPWRGFNRARVVSNQFNYASSGFAANDAQYMLAA